MTKRDIDMAGIEWVPITKVFENPANPRVNDDAIEHVAASLQRFGWQQPIVAQTSGIVIAGNTRLKAAKRLGMVEVPVVWFQGSQLDATAFGIADNRTSEFASWDEAALAALLEQLRNEDAIEGVGFTDAQIDALIAQSDDGLASAGMDPKVDPPEDPVTRPGDVWILGEHRLICGDSTSKKTINRLMDGERANLVITDRVPKGKKLRQVQLAEGATICVGSENLPTNLLQVSRDSHYYHPTQKPAELALRAVQNSSEIGGIVLDLFGGGGFVLLACEASGRRARLSELSPKFCDVIVRRFEEASGKLAFLEDGTTYADLEKDRLKG